MTFFSLHRDFSNVIAFLLYWSSLWSLRYFSWSDSLNDSSFLKSFSDVFCKTQSLQNAILEKVTFLFCETLQISFTVFFVVFNRLFPFFMPLVSTCTIRQSNLFLIRLSRFYKTVSPLFPGLLLNFTRWFLENPFSSIPFNREPLAITSLVLIDKWSSTSFPDLLR